LVLHSSHDPECDVDIGDVSSNAFDDLGTISGMQRHLAGAPRLHQLFFCKKLNVLGVFK
jgi:hypothetical protein